MVLVTCRFKGQRRSAVMRARTSDLSVHLHVLPSLHYEVLTKYKQLRPCFREVRHLRMWVAIPIGLTSALNLPIVLGLSQQNI
jgi:hypothetical protein